MFADRADVLPHLRLVSELSPNGEFAAQAKDLALHLERLVANEKKPQTAVDERTLSEAEKAELYLSQMKDVRCPQLAQPGFIIPYLAIFEGGPDQKPPTVKLRELGMIAAPALIKALEDDTPTRTVYHWRDFDRSRLVWRVSDFAWYILRDITKKEFGYRNTVGFTLSSLAPVEKRRVIEEIKHWYATNKGLSEEERMLGFFFSNDSDDWITAGNYFVKQRNQIAGSLLLEKIRLPVSNKGELCELVARFGDPAAKDVIRDVMTTNHDPSDRLLAAIALWTLGDDTGIPIAIEYVKAKDPPLGHWWDEPVWFLMRTKSKESMEALKFAVTESSPSRAGGVVYCITGSISGDMSGERREPAGCVEICPVLIAAMQRPEYTSGTTANQIKIRIKDVAAKAFILLRDGTDGPSPGHSPLVDPAIFNQNEKDEAKRDAQIKDLIKWYEENKSKLSWDAEAGKLRVID